LSSSAFPGPWAADPHGAGLGSLPGLAPSIRDLMLRGWPLAGLLCVDIGGSLSAWERAVSPAADLG
jgi:hypothetical protein